MSGWLLLLLGVATSVAAANSWRPRRSLLLLAPSWLVAMVVVELALHLVLVGVAAAAVLMHVGALGEAPGWIGLSLLGAGAGGMLPHTWSSLRTTIDVEGRPEELELSANAPRFPWLQLVIPLLAPWRRGVRHDRGVVYGEADGRRLRLDVYRAGRPGAGPRPAVIWVHGGAWLFGTRHEQGLPLLNHLAANGWVGLNIDYRLSPAATLPDHVEDVKRAIAWVREHADELGVDASFVALTGGSAGGHLTALAALTADDTTLQPGFEDADASVQAAVPLYGVYDLVDSEQRHIPVLRRVVEWLVVKARVDYERERFERVSPLHRIHAGAPPFFIVHGSSDSLVPLVGAREFAEQLRASSDAPVLYAEMRGAQHAFDVFPSVRTARIVCAIERFLAVTYAQHAEAAPAGEGEPAEQELAEELAAS